jgi:LCP family protein required for cell wall assembly
LPPDDASEDQADGSAEELPDDAAPHGKDPVAADDPAPEDTAPPEADPAPAEGDDAAPPESAEASPEAGADTDADAAQVTMPIASALSPEEVARAAFIKAESTDGDVAGDDHTELTENEERDRATVQANLRKERKKAKKHRHRWLRRTLYSLLSLVLLVVAAGAGLYFYAGYRFDQIKKVHAKHLIKQAAPGKPFNILLVGSDSRAFVDNPTESNAFGSASNQGGQRSDVTMVARFVPATKTITILSIPRDLWVDIPANNSDIQGMNRINAAYNSGPDLLVETVEKVLHIPINHYMAVDFPGFQGMVQALGGVTMDFPTQIRDSYTGLNITTTGCQVVDGQEALQLVRARHLQYINSNGYWEYDGLSDFSRIQRQDSFFRAILAKVNTSLHNPLAINGFISAAVGNLTIDDTLTKGDLFNLATTFRGLSSSHLITETLPTLGYVTDGGADVLLEAQPYADNTIKAFNQIGLPKPKPVKPLPTVAHSLVDVQVFNAGAATGAAHDMATALTSQGYDVVQIGDAPKPIAAGSPSQIWYGPTGKDAAHALGASLTGPVRYVTDPNLTGNTVALFIVGSQLTTTGSTTTTTTTTAPGSSATSSTTTTTTIPSDVYTNKQAEPWNPVPCSL